MSDLITMLEQADCGSRELDARIGVAVDFKHEGCPTTWRELVEIIGIERAAEAAQSHQSFWSHALPHYSTSLDAALSALPEGWEYSITTVYGFVAVELPLNCGDHVPSVRVIRADCNAALALITAILKATREAGE